jgi:hypothetical protein
MDRELWEEILNSDLLYEDQPCYDCGMPIEVSRVSLCIGCNRVVCPRCYTSSDKPHDPYDGVCRFRR